MFESRPQVKRPRACGKCQQKRQQTNEKAWHNRNKGLYDLKYHQIQKTERYKKINLMAEEFFRLVAIGKTFLGTTMELVGLEKLFRLFLISFGIRKINKFWFSPKSPSSKEAEGSIG